MKKKSFITLPILLLTFVSLFAQKVPLLNYYEEGEKILTAKQQNTYDQLQQTNDCVEVNIASVNPISSVVAARSFEIILGQEERVFSIDHMRTKPNGDFFLTAVSGNDEAGGLSSFTGSKYEDHGFIGKYHHNPSHTFYSINPLVDPNDRGNTISDVMVCHHDPVSYEKNSGCITPVTELDPDEDPETDNRSNCNRAIRVLFLFTNRAVASGFDPDLVAQNVIDEMNVSVEVSENSPTAFYINAGAVPIPSFIEFDDIGEDLEDLMHDPIANQLRDNNYADLVVLLTNSLGYTAAGKAQDIRTDEDSAYSIAQIQAAVFGFTASHEIGHMLGCRHQRCIVCGGAFQYWEGCDSWGRGHGYTICETGRSIMYQNGCDTRTRMARWSNDNQDFMDCSTGTWWNNNIRSMRNHACTVADFRPDPWPDANDFVVTIDGPGSICLGGFENWSALISQEQNSGNSYSYLWEKSLNGFDNWCEVGDDSSTLNQYNLVYNCFSSQQFYLRLTVSLVSDPDVFYFDQKYIEFATCADGSDSIESRSQSSRNDLTLYPNPTSDVVEVNAKRDDIIGLYDIQGQKLNFTIEDTSNGCYIDIAALKDGTYFVALKDKSDIKSLKIIKQ